VERDTDDDDDAVEEVSVVLEVRTPVNFCVENRLLRLVELKTESLSL
jgi:hypothetical protein